MSADRLFRVSVAIPTLNGGEAFSRCLASLREQAGVEISEIVIADSRSTDGTPEIARRAGARVIEIAREEFGHGRTRNQLVAEMRCDLILLTVQDAVLLGPGALSTMVSELEADSSLAALSARQVPGRDADLHSRYQLENYDRTVMAPPQPEGEVADRTFPHPAAGVVDNVCALIRRTAWEEIGFRELDFGEDLDFGARAVARGWGTAFSREPLVAHHHDRSSDYLLSRAAVQRHGAAGHGDESKEEAMPEARLGLLPVASGIRATLRELETAIRFPADGRVQVDLRVFLDEVAREFGAGLPLTLPDGELGLIDDLLEGVPVGDVQGTPAVRRGVTDLLGWLHLRDFAQRAASPVPVEAARTFIARVAASRLGQGLGEAMRRESETPPAQLLHRVLTEDMTAHLERRESIVAGARGRPPQQSTAVAHTRAGSDPGEPSLGARGDTTPFAVVGMHRSGTSLTARILNLLGIDFGPEATMLPPQLDNPVGYWEQRAIMELNDEVLDALGGSWSDAPDPPLGWESAAELRSLEARTRKVLGEHFEAARRRGWKDPRMSITLPLWQRVVPDMRYVVCIRNPKDVARSLESREGDMGSPQVPYDLWLAYTAAALRHTAGRPRLLVFYEDYFGYLGEQIDRLAAFAGLEPADIPPTARSEIESFMDRGLWHHRTSVWPLVRDSDVPIEVKALYLTLVTANDRPTPERTSALADVATVADEYAARLSDARRARRHDAERIVELNLEVATRSEELVTLHRQLDACRKKLDSMQASTSWRLTAPLRDAKRRGSALGERLGRRGR